MTSGPGSKRLAYQDLADHLRAQIISGELQPGARLPVEPDLSAAYGVSRSTVREALRVLSSQNLVVTTRGVSGGSFVVHPGVDQISDYLQTTVGLLAASAEVSMTALLEVRAMLEVPAAGLAARRRSDEQLALLRTTLLDPVESDPDALHEANRCFHSTLLEAAGNPLLEVVARPVWGVLNERYFREHAPQPFWLQVIHDHREILGHVESSDDAGAREAADAHLDHLRVAYDAIEDHLEA